MISVAVMAHPKRAEMVRELVEILDRPPDSVAWDSKNDRWHTGRRALLAYDGAASHHLVIQDDALPCRDLVAGIERALPFVPERSPMMLYVGRARPHRKIIERAVATATAGVSWLSMAETYWGPALVIPTDLIDELVEWCDGQSEANYDRRIGRWFRDQRIPVYAPWPSLVEHRDAPSLIRNRTSGRTAHEFIGLDASALDVDWTGTVVEVRDPRGPVRETSTKQKPTPSTRPFPARVGIPAGDQMNRNEIVAQIKAAIPDDADLITRAHLAIAAKWLLGPPDGYGTPVEMTRVEMVRGILVDIEAIRDRPDQALAFADDLTAIDDRYPPVETPAPPETYECRPIRGPAAAGGRRYTYRRDAVKFLATKKGGWLHVLNRDTGERLRIERIDETGASVE